MEGWNTGLKVGILDLKLEYWIEGWNTGLKAGRMEGGKDSKVGDG